MYELNLKLYYYHELPGVCTYMMYVYIPRDVYY